MFARSCVFAVISNITDSLKKRICIVKPNRWISSGSSGSTDTWMERTLNKFICERERQKRFGDKHTMVTTSLHTMNGLSVWDGTVNDIAAAAVLFFFFFFRCSFLHALCWCCCYCMLAQREWPSAKHNELYAQAHTHKLLLAIKTRSLWTCVAESVTN